jgi:hypothetical protein
MWKTSGLDLSPGCSFDTILTPTPLTVKYGAGAKTSNPIARPPVWTLAGRSQIRRPADKNIIRVAMVAARGQAHFLSLSRNLAGAVNATAMLPFRRLLAAVPF